MKKLLCLLMAVLMFTSCSSGLLNYFNKKAITGDRNVLGRTYPMDFDSNYSIVIKDIMIEEFNAAIIYDETLPDSLVITTDENIFLSFDVKVDEDNRIITIQGNPDYKYIPTTFEITIGGLADNIDISGAFNLDMKFSEIKNPVINFSGAVSGTVLLDNAESITLNLSGASTLTFDGIADKFTADISGAATINGYELKTNTADLNVSGTSFIKVTVNEELYVEMSGASNVYYKGDGKLMKSEISGLGEIIKED